jgi:exosome complex component CSL4
MMKKSAKNGDIAITGQFLGVVEEYLPDKNSTFVKEGEIFSTKTGVISINKNKREIEIKTLMEQDRKTVEIGDIVIGTILFLRKFSVGISFFAINNKLHFNSSYMGNIHVSQISNRYVDRISDAFQITDVVRAKVVGTKSGEYVLSTVGNDLGIIHTDCAICGTHQKKVGFNKLKCPRCGNFEKRKLSDDFGDVSMNFRY